MNKIEEYFKERDERMRGYNQKTIPKNSVRAFSTTMHECQWVKNWSWMGVPILQLPTDMFAIQELIWKVRPNNIIEIGVAFGGMTLFCASLLEQVCSIPPRVIGVDVEFREHTHKVINDFTRYRYKEDIEIILIEGSSIDFNIVSKVSNYIKPEGAEVLVILDSNHTHDHVLKELQLYSPMVSVGSYIIVMDTSIEWLDPKYIGDRPWGKGNSPWTAVKEFMKGNEEFVIDQSIEERILLTSAPDGWLRRIK